MDELIFAYLNEALPFAIIHGGLVLVCFSIWFRDWFQINEERRALEDLKLNPTSPQSKISRVGQLAAFSFSLAQKGSITDAESLIRRLVKAVSTRDAILRVCINGLVVVGLLGTLFNLWRLGPAFWSALLEGTNPDRSAIGVAFAASFFGLFWALALNLIDNSILRPRRGAFARDSTEWILSKAVEKLPHSADASVSEGLKKFTDTSEAILASFSTQQGLLTQSFVNQIRESSSSLDERLTTIVSRWESFLEGASEKIEEGGTKLHLAAQDLTSATNLASSTLTKTTETLESYKNLSELIAQVRTESAELVSEVTRRMEGFTSQMETTLSNLTTEHARAFEHESQESNRRLSDLIDSWHTNNSATLGRFGSTIQKVGDDISRNWQDLSTSVDKRTDQLVNSWHGTLNRAVIDLTDSLKGINEQVKANQALSATMFSTAEVLSRTTKVGREQRTEFSTPTYDQPQQHSQPSQPVSEARPPVGGTNSTTPYSGPRPVTLPPHLVPKKPWYRKWF